VLGPFKKTQSVGDVEIPSMLPVLEEHFGLTESEAAPDRLFD
jgi:hypothetical protein